MRLHPGATRRGRAAALSQAVSLGLDQVDVLDRDERVDVLVLVELHRAVGRAGLMDPTVREVVVVPFHIAEHLLDVGDQPLNMVLLTRNLEVVNMLGQHEHQLKGRGCIAATSRLWGVLRRAGSIAPNTLVLELQFLVHRRGDETDLG